MSYFLPPQGLQQLWDHVLAAVCQPGYQDFRDPELRMEAKGTKLSFKYPDAPSDLLAVMNSFDYKLHRILDFSHHRCAATGCTLMWVRGLPNSQRCFIA
jgi:hypothetical protein